MHTPLCPYFNQCGGCTTQHIPYDAQLANKKKALAQAISYDETKIQVFSDKEYYYRNKIEFLFHPHGLGLRTKNPSMIMNIDACVIAEEPINTLLKEIKTFFKTVDAYDRQKKTGTFLSVVIRTDGKEQGVCFLLSETSSKLREAVEYIEEYAKQSTAQHILIAYASVEKDNIVPTHSFALKGSNHLQTTYLGKTFSYPLLGFFQNNHTMAEKMQEYVHSLLKKYALQHTDMPPIPQAHLLDLYAGVGTFGITNANLFKSVTMVESFEESTKATQKNIVTNGITHAEALTLDAKKIKKLSFPQLLFVITDPPRSGMDTETINALKKLSPEVIVYVSCNVQQLRKELMHLKNYTIKSAALFDLFPQTWHSEAVIELIRQK